MPRESFVDGSGLLFIRRATEWGRDYFLANHGDQPLDRWLTFRTEAEAAALLDPMTGRIGMAASRGNGADFQVYLQLEPGESIIVRTLGKNVDGPAWQYDKSVGSPVPLSGTWTVKFLQGGPELPSGFETTQAGFVGRAGGRPGAAIRRHGPVLVDVQRPGGR